MWWVLEDAPHSLVPTWINIYLVLRLVSSSQKELIFSSRLSANMKEKALAET